LSPPELRERRRALLERMSRLDVTAPVSGIVYDLRVFARRSWQHQGRHHKHPPVGQHQTRAKIPRRVRIPLQQALRSRGHDPPPDLGQRLNPADALPPAEIG